MKLGKRIILIMLCFLFLGSIIGCTNNEIEDPEIEANNEWPASEAANDSNFTDTDLIWQDEFNGNTLSSFWVHETGTGTNGWGNQEKQYYRPENARVNGGKLQIIAKKEVYQTSQYTSSRITTNGKFSIKYGKIEARIKLPVGEGFWPAFWMMPADSTYGKWPRSGEIDIMEARGRFPKETSSTIHYGMPWKYDHETNYFPLLGDITINDWHTYGVEWTENTISFFVDGETFVTFNNWYSAPSDKDNKLSGKQPFDQEFYIILNLAVGGTFDGQRVPSNEMFAPAVMEVDYVRVYKHSNTTSTTNGVRN